MKAIGIKMVDLQPMTANEAIEKVIKPIITLVKKKVMK